MVGTICFVEYRREIRYAFAPLIEKLSSNVPVFTNPEKAIASFSKGSVPEVLLMHARFPLPADENPAEYRRAAALCNDYISKGGEVSHVFVIRSVGSEEMLRSFGFPEGVNHIDLGRQTPEEVISMIARSVEVESLPV